MPRKKTLQLLVISIGTIQSPGKGGLAAAGHERQDRDAELGKREDILSLR
jgi:hypothetical protein